MPIRAPLQKLFALIEKEFEILYAENVNLREKLEAVAGPSHGSIGERGPLQDADVVEVDEAVNKKSKQGSKVKAGYNLRTQPSRVVKHVKAQSVANSMVREFCGHKKDVSQVTTKPGQPIISTASADHSACVWGIDTGRCLLRYQGHSGSVNSIKFHPTRDIVLTGSEDATAQVWLASVNCELTLTTAEEELDEQEEGSDEEQNRTDVPRTPLCVALVKVWELRNMHSPLTTIRTDSGVNRLAVSASGMIAVLQDNCHIRLFELNGQRIARLPRIRQQAHQHKVSSVAWAEDITARCNLFSSGFDRRGLGWGVCVPPKDN